MISTTEIGKLIARPEIVVPTLSTDLKILADKYPYAQVFPILLLRSLKVGNDVHFEEELKKNSFRISDRSRLYDLILEQNEYSASDLKTIESPKIEESPVEEKISLNQEEEIQPSIEEVIISENEELSEETEDQTRINLVELDPLEESILHNSLANNYKLDDLTDEEEQALELRQKEQEENLTEKIGLNDPAEKFTPELTIDAKQSFTSWLHADRNYTEEDNSDKKAINAVVDSFSEFDPMEDLFGEVKKPKADFFSPVKKAKESLSEDTLPVSETLAKIYALQGNYPKAIEAYQQLSLKYPEKKIFFANLIKDLKKLINK